MRNFRYLLFFLLLCVPSQISASQVHYKLIFSADKNRTAVINNLLKIDQFFSQNTQAKEFQCKHKFFYKEESFGEIYAIVFSPLDIASVEILTLKLQPYFDDIVSIEETKEDDAFLFEYLPAQKLQNFDFDWLKNILLQLYYWLDKWYMMVILLLIGVYFFYKRSRQFSQITILQHAIAKKQKLLEERLKGRDN